MEGLFDFKETCKILGLGKDSLLDLLHSKELKAFKLKGKWRIRESDITDFLKREEEKFHR